MLILIEELYYILLAMYGRRSREDQQMPLCSNGPLFRYPTSPIRPKRVIILKMIPSSTVIFIIAIVLVVVAAAIINLIPLLPPIHFYFYYY